MRSAFSWALRIFVGFILSLSGFDPLIRCSRRPLPRRSVSTATAKSRPTSSPTGSSASTAESRSPAWTCHGDQHTSASDVAKAKIPTPETCAQCHETQVAQFKKGKHAMAWAAMKAMPTIHWQPMAMTEGEKGCGGCHKIGDKTLDRSRSSCARTVRHRIRRGAVRRLPHPPHLLRRRSPPAASLRDLPHGLRPSAVGDVFRLQARRAK